MTAEINRDVVIATLKDYFWVASGKCADCNKIESPKTNHVLGRLNISTISQWNAAMDKFEGFFFSNKPLVEEVLTDALQGLMNDDELKHKWRIAEQALLRNLTRTLEFAALITEYGTNGRTKVVEATIVEPNARKVIDSRRWTADGTLTADDVSTQIMDFVTSRGVTKIAHTDRCLPMSELTKCKDCGADEVRVPWGGKGQLCTK